ncbi:hypothetical protein M408DRAFT_321197, partial [Serendipita vermifera MAFF 305830]
LLTSCLVLRLLICVVGALASFTTLTCTSENECITPDKDGIFCYSPNQSTRPRGDSVCRSSYWQNVTSVHVASPTSIGYYEKRTLTRLGNHTCHVIRQVYACASGQLTDGTYQSVCGYASEDNNVMSPYCAVAIGQPYVEDGCYAPDHSNAAVQVANSFGAPPGPSSSSSGGSGSPLFTSSAISPRRACNNHTLCLFILALSLAVITLWFNV